MVGVQEVQNRLSVVPRATVIDPDIEEDILEALERNSAVDPSSIRVEVTKGIVTLSGRVPTWDMCNEAEDVARCTIGATGVRNKLTVE